MKRVLGSLMRLHSCDLTPVFRGSSKVGGIARVNLCDCQSDTCLCPRIRTHILFPARGSTLGLRLFEQLELCASEGAKLVRWAGWSQAGAFSPTEAQRLHSLQQESFTAPKPQHTAVQHVKKKSVQVWDCLDAADRNSSEVSSISCLCIPTAEVEPSSLNGGARRAVTALIHLCSTAITLY